MKIFLLFLTLIASVNAAEEKTWWLIVGHSVKKENLDEIIDKHIGEHNKLQPVTGIISDKNVWMLAETDAPSLVELSRYLDQKESIRWMYMGRVECHVHDKFDLKRNNMDKIVLHKLPDDYQTQKNDDIVVVLSGNGALIGVKGDTHNTLANCLE